MSTIFMNSGNKETSYAHELRLNLTDRIYLGGGDNHVALSGLSIYYIWNNIKKLYKFNKLEK